MPASRKLSKTDSEAQPSHGLDLYHAGKKRLGVMRETTTGIPYLVRHHNERDTRAVSGLSAKATDGGHWFRKKKSTSPETHRAPRTSTHGDIYRRTTDTRPVSPTAIVIQPIEELQVAGIVDGDEGDNRVVGEVDDGEIDHLRDEDRDENSETDSDEDNEQNSDEDSGERSDEQSEEAEQGEAELEIEEIDEEIDKRREGESTDEAVRGILAPQSEFSWLIQLPQSSTLS